MQRLLQGDVGSGKTVVAALAMLRAVENGHQAALMAPTEILAEQHYRKLAAMARTAGHPRGLAVRQPEEARQGARWPRRPSPAGEAPIAIGTHALIEDAVDFSRLGLAMVDEQHRFGVRQRLALRREGRFSRTS
jgi:ATP-dependent DNA helicase RecG